MATITSEQVIDSAKRMLKLTSTNEFDGDFNIWVQIGWRKLYNLNTYQKFDAYIPISNGRIKKPNGYYEFIGAAIQANTPIVFYNDKYRSTTTSPTPIEVEFYEWTNTVMEIGDYLDFGSLTGSETQVHLWWLGIPVDEDCNLIVEEDAEEALKYFLAWKWSESNNGIDFEKKIQYYAGMFDREAGILRGKIAARDARQRKYEQTSTASSVLTFYHY